MFVAADVAGLQIVMVNVYFIGTPDRWVLVDAGTPMGAGRIVRNAEKRFGPGARPQAIILTHGHFDHIGSLRKLLERWDIPVYAHELELPYLAGRSAYPPPDPTVGGGLMARTSPLFPRGPFDFGPWIRPLPADASVPGVVGWRWIWTPGHSPGHVSLFRDSDRTLVAGDAFTTQKQESLVAVLTNAHHVHGPPKYYTIDWNAAKHSVQELARLQPAAAGTGHGLPMSGDLLRSQLTALSLHFDELAVPRHGRYVRDAAMADRDGIVWVPPPVPDPLPKIAAAVLIAGVAALAITALTRRRRQLS
jgi:glyoxylase-like metal-dependent hydrolase (beta-lactamase superfamily II)